MDTMLEPFSLDDLLADTDLAPKPAPPGAGTPWPTYPFDEDPEEIRRTRLQAKALSSGPRIRGWTRMKGRDLWRVWVTLFEGDEDLALDSAIHSAERVVRSKGPESKKRLYEIKRRLAGYHARGMLEERYKNRGIDGVWNTKPWDLPDEDEYRNWPVPWKGLIAILKHVVVKRRKVRPSDL